MSLLRQLFQWFFNRWISRWIAPAMLAAVMAAGAVVSAAERPNLLVFIADDLGDGDLGCYGHPVVRTPHIDRLAKEGVRFTSAILTISSCSPSRSSILTGRYPHNTGAEDLHMPLPADQKTVASYLGDAGYYRASLGKWHLGAAEKGNWDRVVESQPPSMPLEFSRILEDCPSDRPFFFWIASIDPHRPFQDDTIAAPHDPTEVAVPPYLPDHPKIRKELAQYYDEVSRFDLHIGMMRRELEKAGRWDNTVVVFMSDNGMPFPRAKTTLYDSGIRTPFIVRWPEAGAGVVEAGSVQPALVSALDLAPTLLEIAGVKPTTMEGRSLLPLLTGETDSIREAAFAEANWHDFEKFTRAVRTDRWKLIRNYYWDQPLWNSVDSINSITWQGMLEAKEAGTMTEAQAFLFQPQRPFEEFYDLESDPYELTNLAESPTPEIQDKLARLRTLLDNWRVETGDRMPAERVPDGWTREGNPLPHNQPWYDRWLEQGKKNSFEKF